MLTTRQDIYIHCGTYLWFELQGPTIDSGAPSYKSVQSKQIIRILMGKQVQHTPDMFFFYDLASLRKTTTNSSAVTSCRFY